MPIDVVMGVAALVFAVIAAGYFYETYQARRQARALEADDHMREHCGIPAELRARRQSQQPQPKHKSKPRKHGNAA